MRSRIGKWKGYCRDWSLRKVPAAALAHFERSTNLSQAKGISQKVLAKLSMCPTPVEVIQEPKHPPHHLQGALLHTPQSSSSTHPRPVSPLARPPDTVSPLLSHPHWATVPP